MTTPAENGEPDERVIQLTLGSNEGALPLGEVGPDRTIHLYSSARPLVVHDVNLQKSLAKHGKLYDFDAPYED